MISRVRGTEDLLDLKIHNFTLEQLKKILSLYNFTEIQTPILEPTSLFVRAVGEQTDIVSKEMYIIDTEKEESICLRPEATASVVRAYIENGIQIAPWKVYTYGPMFRKERPQKGRWRQFTQVSIEVLNINETTYDAHFIKMLNTFFSDYLKIENYVIKINFLGCLEDRKKHKASLLTFLEKHTHDICSTCNERKDKNTLRVFDCKSETCKNIYLNAPKIIEHLCPLCVKEWEKLTGLLKILSINYIIDHFLVRGLDYYNNTVFEFCSRDLGAQNAFCGGGRYTLGKEIGGKDDCPSIGVGIGLGRLLMLVEKSMNKLSVPQQLPLHLVIPLSVEQHALALLIAAELQAHQLCTDILLNEASLSNLMKKANKMGARFVLLIGQDEQTQGTVTIKNMLAGSSSTVQQSALIQALK
jgi:histidyl-tRNA synthetase